MNLAPSLSIAMCTWNGARFLAEMLDSLEAQSVAPDEIVIGDDNSADDTMDILERFARRSRVPVRVHRNEVRIGSNANFSATLARCSGQLVALADQDDVWRPHKVERLKSAMSSGAVFGFSNAAVIDAAGEQAGYDVWEAVRLHPAHREAIASGLGFDVLVEHRLVTGCCSVISATLVPLIVPVPELWPPSGRNYLPHDAWIAMCASAVGPIAVIEEPLLSYRRHVSQAVGVPDPTVTPTRRWPDPPYAISHAKWTAQVIRVLESRGARPNMPGVDAALQRAAVLHGKQAAKSH